MQDFDIAIIGGGPAGYVGAIRAAQLKARVCLIEKDALGGTCLNRGCIPTKALYYSARTLAAVKKSSVFGVSTGEVGFDLEKAVERKDGIVKRLVSGVEQLLKGNGVEVIYGTAYVEGTGSVRVTTREGNGEVVAAKKILISTGSEPALIPAFNIDGKNVITSTEALNLKKVPSSILIIGGGVMGCEFANLFSKFGSSVLVVEVLPALLSAEDGHVARVVMRSFKTAGVEVHTGATVEGVEAADGRVKTVLKDGREFFTEKVLVTIGRSFNSSGIGLDKIGVEKDNGRIKTDDRMETSVKGIYAAGDVTGRMLLAHVASAQTMVAVSSALGKDARMDYSVIPYGVFTDPEIAGVGLREKDAKEKGMDVKVGRFPYAASGKALAMNESDGFVQVLSDPSTDRVLGCSIVGAHATDLIGEAALAMKTGMKIKDIMDTIHAHPTLPEVVMEAAEDAHGMAVHKLGRK